MRFVVQPTQASNNNINTNNIDNLSIKPHTHEPPFCAWCCQPLVKNDEKKAMFHRKCWYAEPEDIKTSCWDCDTCGVCPCICDKEHDCNWDWMPFQSSNQLKGCTICGVTVSMCYCINYHPCPDHDCYTVRVRDDKKYDRNDQHICNCPVKKLCLCTHDNPCVICDCEVVDNIRHCMCPNKTKEEAN